MTTPDWQPGPTGTEEVLFATTGSIGRILLNRPRAINALTIEMVVAVQEQLTTWATDDAIGQVVLTGAGERGLCAGGDVRQMRELALTEGHAMSFLGPEYRMNRTIAEYPKPFTAIQDGIVMGGGLGISAHGSLRVATQNTTVAMPETMIGFFPDVGMRWHLAQAPGELGMWFALTGRSGDAAAALTMGFSDVTTDPADDDTDLSAAREWVDECFTGDDPRVMVERLRNLDHPDARAAAVDITARSPWAVWVTAVTLRRAAGATMAEVLADDARIAETMTAHPDFVEGVAAKMIDKRPPVWADANLASVDEAAVRAVG